MTSMKGLRAVLAALGLLLTVPAHAQSIFWIDTNFPMPMLGRANDDGTNPQQVPLVVGTLPEGLALDGGNGKLYWGEEAWSGANLNLGDVDLGNLHALIGGGSSMRGVALDMLHDRVYWTSSNLVDGGQIHRANLDGSSPAVIASLGSGANPRAIVVDGLGGRLFWADYDQNAIFKSDLDGLGITVVSGSLSTPWGLALDPAGTALYLTEYSTGLIRRFALPAGPLTTPVSGLANPTYLAIESGSGKMYWSEAGAGAQKVQRANLDGTQVQNLGLPLQTYGGIAVGPGQPTATLLVMLTAGAVPDGIEVRWRFANPGSFAATEVERADDGSASWQVVSAALRQEAGVTIALDRDVVAGRAYQYRLSATAPGGAVTRFGPVAATAGGEVVAFELAPVTPNPSRGLTRIDYAVARESRVRLAVIDVLGREVARLVDGTQTPGRHQAIWTGEAARGRARAGLYFVRYETPARVFVRRLVLAP